MKTVLFLLASLCLVRCADVYQVSSDFRVVGHENKKGEFVSERSSGELIDLMQKVATEINPRAAKFGRISDAWVQKVILEDGSEQYFLFANEKAGEGCSALAIALSTSSSGAVQLWPSKTCVHRCSASGLNPCDGNCNMTILEACSRVMCSCSGIGGCTAEIIITYDE